MSALAPLLLAAAVITPGQWRVTTHMRIAATPSVSVPPEPVVNLVETSSGQLVDFVVAEFLDPKCKLTGYDDAGSTLSARQICRSREFGKREWTLEGRYSATRVETQLVVRGKRNGHPEIVTKDMVAELVSSGAAETDRNIVIPNGEMMQIGAIETLKVWTHSDSRCPKDANCYWQGDTSAAYLYQRIGKPHRHGILTWSNLQAADAKDAVACIDNRRIALIDVEPRTRSSFQTKPEEYRFHVRLGQC